MITIIGAKLCDRLRIEYFTLRKLVFVAFPRQQAKTNQPCNYTDKKVLHYLVVTVPVGLLTLTGKLVLAGVAKLATTGTCLALVAALLPSSA